MTHAAMRWLYEKDQIAYFLACATIRANQPLKSNILNLMSETQRELARKAMDGSWKRY